MNENLSIDRHRWIEVIFTFPGLVLVKASTAARTFWKSISFSYFHSLCSLNIFGSCLIIFISSFVSEVHIRGRHFHMISEKLYFPFWHLVTNGRGHRVSFSILTKGMFLHIKHFEIIQKVLSWEMKIFPQMNWFFPWMSKINVFCRAAFDLDMWKE